METKIQLLDCTLRDGCYIVDGNFGDAALKGLIRKLEAARVDFIECGWLKNAPHAVGSAYFHVPGDVIPYFPPEEGRHAVRVAMIDWDRYDLDQLPRCDGNSLDAIRMVFPQGKFREALKLAPKITGRGYRLFLQAANTLGYSDGELRELAEAVNPLGAEALSIVDTFGAMYPEDLARIFETLHKTLEPRIKLGFHSHNNQQLSFALTMEFLKLAAKTERPVVVDSSLCGMGRGAGNAPTELTANLLNRKYAGDYDMNEIMDAIDQYLSPLEKRYRWGYSIPYCIAGIYGSHVNNITYLLHTHHTLTRDLRILIESIPPDVRKKYDYDNLEKIFVQYQNHVIDDSRALAELRNAWSGRECLLLAPGRTLRTEEARIRAYIEKHRPVVIGINAIPEKFRCDWLFFSTPARYQYAFENFSDRLRNTPTVLTSNIKLVPDGREMIVNFNLLIKLGWRFFDNACIMALRLLNKLEIGEIAFAGFDGFPERAESMFYADPVLQMELTSETKNEINSDVTDMLRDFQTGDKGRTHLQFVTTSRFAGILAP